MDNATKSLMQDEQSELLDLVEQLTDLLQAGDRSGMQEILQQHPEYASQLRDILPSLEVLAEFQQASRATTSTGGVVMEPIQGLLGDFRILRQVGRGGMGVVYEAEQISIPRRVALKVLPLAALIDSRSLQRFRNEVAAIATLEHPHIVSVYAVGEDRGIHYYAMKLIRGQSLAAVICELRIRASHNESISGEVINHVISNMEVANEKKVSGSFIDDEPDLTAVETRARGRSSTLRQVGDQTYFRNVVRLILQAANALQHAHDHGIVHRDIKPGNLMLDTHGSLFVTDFGLARIETAVGVTMTGDVLGTLRYMSPEQVLGNRVMVDHRTDVYSLGATLYELLTLQPIWSGENKAELIRQISFEEPTRPKKINPSIPTDLETIVLKAISKNPGDRYVSAHAFGDDLQAFLDKRSISAKRPTTAQRISKWTRRNPAIMWSAIAILAIISAALAIGNFAINKERVAKELALLDAQKSEKAAKESQLQTQAIADFVIFDIIALTSAEGRGRFTGSASLPKNKDASLRDLLDRAAEKLAQRRDLDPRTEADLFWIIGISYRGLGEFDQAVGSLEACLKLRQEHLGDDDWKTLSAMNSLAVAYRSAGKLDHALRLSEETLNHCMTEFGAADPDTLMAMNNLGAGYQAAGKPELALPLFETALMAVKANRGDNDPKTLLIMNNLGTAYLDAGDFGNALPLLEEALEMQIAHVGDDHPDSITTMNNLGNAYHKAGYFDKAIPLLEKTLALSRVVNGEDHLDSIVALTNLGSAYVAVHDLDNAIPRLERALSLMKLKLGMKHASTQVTMNELANAYLAAGEFTKGLQLAEQSLELKQAGLVKDHPQILLSMNVLAAGYWRVNQLDKSIPIFKELLQRQDVTLGRNTRETQLTVFNLGTNYKSAGKIDEALPYLEEGYRFFKNDLVYGHMGAQLIDAYVKLGETDKAEIVANELMQAVYPRLPKDSTNRAHLLAAIGRTFYLPVHAYSKAEVVLRESLAIREQSMPDRWETFETKSMLGRALMGQKKFAEAQSFLLDGYQGMSSRRKLIPPIADSRVPDCLLAIVQLYESWQAEEPNAGYDVHAKKWRSQFEEHIPR